MCVIKVTRLTMAGAEDVVAMLWRTLEELRMPSPQLSVYQTAGGVELNIGFFSQQHADIVIGAAPYLKTEVLLTAEAQPTLD